MPKGKKDKEERTGSQEPSDAQQLNVARAECHPFVLAEMSREKQESGAGNAPTFRCAPSLKET